MTAPVTSTVRGPRLPVLALVTAAALAAGLITWSAVPLAGGQGGLRAALIVAVIGGVLSLAQLATNAIQPRERPIFESVADRIGGLLVTGVRALPWAEVMMIAVIVAEALHRSRPWHTALLAAGLLAYLFSVHLTETLASIGVLRAQVPLIVAGLCLTALSVGAAELPGLSSGPLAAVLAAVAMVACLVAAALVVPAWIGRDS
ncbi:MAG TPA: hypothetical protein VGI58_01335 [Streptosporangiaceae bacterium]|jgi:hypothetical protein